MAGAAKKFNLTELLNQRSKEAGEQQKIRTAAGGSRRRGCHVRRGREQHRRYLRPYTVKGQFLQRGRRART